MGVAAGSEEGDDSVFGVVGVDPPEAFVFGVPNAKALVVKIKVIKVFNDILDALVVLILEEVPVEAGFAVPFGGLTEFAAHK